MKYLWKKYNSKIHLCPLKNERVLKVFLRNCPPYPSIFILLIVVPLNPAPQHSINYSLSPVKLSELWSPLLF